MPRPGLYRIGLSKVTLLAASALVCAMALVAQPLIGVAAFGVDNSIAWLNQLNWERSNLISSFVKGPVRGQANDQPRFGVDRWPWSVSVFATGMVNAVNSANAIRADLAVSFGFLTDTSIGGSVGLVVMPSKPGEQASPDPIDPVIHFSFRCPASIRQAIRRHALGKGISVQALTRQILNEWLSEQGDESIGK